MQAKARKWDSPRVLIEANTAQLRRAVVAAMEAEAVKMFAAPVEGKLEDLV